MAARTRCATCASTAARRSRWGGSPDNCLVCPYHAWHYDAAGRCVRIPQSAHATISAKARTPVYQCQERYGLVWVCLADGDPAYALPEIPELESGGFQGGQHGAIRVAERRVTAGQNFTDFGHFPWVHPGLLGDPERPIVPDHSVDAREHVLHYTIVQSRSAQQRRLPGVRQHRHRRSPSGAAATSCTCPIRSCSGSAGAARRGWCICLRRARATERCRGYFIIGRNYDFDDPDTTLQEFERVIFGQDQRIVESQRPEQVPFDLADELHLKFDAVAVAYRRAMRAQGLASLVPPWTGSS